MKLYLEDEHGNRKQIKKVVGMTEGDIILMIETCMRDDDIERMEQKLSKKFERKVIVLDGRITEILTLPPKK